ncbi:MAG: hypothetical protein ACFFAN_04775 [Promethearchaeota archaeon]
MNTKYKSRGFVKTLLFILIFVNFLIPLSGVSFEIYSNSVNNDYNKVQEFPKTHILSKDDYLDTKILEEEKQGLGIINISDIAFNEAGFFNNSENYYNLDYDLNSDALNITYSSTKFIRTRKIAQVDNLEDIDTRTITIELNETIDIKYDSSIQSLEGYLIYSPRLYPFNLTELYVQNKSSPEVEFVEKEYYSIDDTLDKIIFLKFDFENYFNNEVAHNFSLHLIWEYDLEVVDWELNQYSKSKFLFEEEEYSFEPDFNLRFNIIGKKLNEADQYQILDADNLDIALRVNPPDKDSLSEHELLLLYPTNNPIDETDFLNNYLNADKSINVSLSDYFNASNSLFYLNFKAEFVIKFNEAVDETWAIDRLIGTRRLRERIYFPEIISGPKHIYVSSLRIYEPTIAINQIEDDWSLFGRSVRAIEANVTEVEEENKNSLVFTENATTKVGIEIRLPYIINGEICPFTIEYKTSNDLKVIITDNINMPVMGLDVEFYYYGELYGTYISKEKSQPLGLKTTNENGEIFIEDVPNGNYTLEIYQGNSFIMEAEVSSFLEFNYVKTSLHHFPLWILIFGSISGIVLLIGLIIHLKSRKES